MGVPLPHPLLHRPGAREQEQEEVKLSACPDHFLGSGNVGRLSLDRSCLAIFS
jgi:hypothetical protein